MSNEIKVNLAEIDNVINLMKELRSQADELAEVNTGNQDYLRKNVGRAKDRMNVCEYRTESIGSGLRGLISKTNTFLLNTKTKMEKDDTYLSNQIDTLTK